MRGATGDTFDLNGDSFVQALKTSLACDSPYAPSNPTVLKLDMPARVDMDEDRDARSGHIRTSGSHLNLALYCGMASLMLLCGDDAFLQDWTSIERIPRKSSIPTSLADIAPRTTTWRRVRITRPHWTSSAIDGQLVDEEEASFALLDEIAEDKVQLAEQPADLSQVALSATTPGDLPPSQNVLELSLDASLARPSDGISSTGAPKKKTKRGGIRARRRQATRALREAEAALRGRTAETEADDQELAISCLWPDMLAAQTDSNPPRSTSAVQPSEDTTEPLPQVKKKKPHRRGGHKIRMLRRAQLEQEKLEYAANRAAELEEAKAYLATFADIPGNVTFVSSGPWRIPKTTTEAFAPVYPAHMAQDFPALPLSTEISRSKCRQRCQPSSEPGIDPTEELPAREMESIARHWCRISDDFREMCSIQEPEDEDPEDDSECTETKPKRPKRSLFSWVNAAFMAAGHPSLSPPCVPKTTSSVNPSTSPDASSILVDIPPQEHFDTSVVAAPIGDVDITTPTHTTDTTTPEPATVSLAPTRKIKLPRILLEVLAPATATADSMRFSHCSPLRPVSLQ